jgi:hypothetical protein
MAAKSIGLSEVIEMVRSELDDAIKKGEGEKVRFRSQKVTLELEMGTSRSADGSGGVRLWVLDLGATGRIEQRRGHRVTIELEPVFGNELREASARGDDLVASDRNPFPGADG